MALVKKNKIPRGSLGRLWHWVRWPLLVLVLAYVALVIYRIPAVGEKEKTDAAVAKIHAMHITRADVNGEALPRVPYQPENDATVAGIDKNNNGIRDDVEIAIANLHPDSAKVRAAELQYAMALQLMLTDVFNSETWKAAAVEGSRGDLCIGLTYPRTDLDQYLKITDERSQEVKDLVLNTSLRQETWNNVYSYATSFGLPNSGICNIDLSTLPN